MTYTTAVEGREPGEPGPEERAPEEFTIDELAARTGATVRTIRFYVEQGLIPPPERRGRMAYYGEQQRMRLELVKQLQDYGYTLTAIGQVLARLPVVASATDIALRTSLLSPWSLPELEVTDHAELERRAGRSLSERDVEVLVAVGALVRDPEGVLKVRPALLSSGLHLVGVELPLDAFAEVAALVEGHMSTLASELIDLLLRQLASRENRNLLGKLSDVLPAVRPLLIQSLVRRFNGAIDRTLTKSVDAFGATPRKETL